MNNKVTGVFIEQLIELVDVNLELVNSGMYSNEDLEKLLPLLHKAETVLNATFDELEKM